MKRIRVAAGALLALASCGDPVAPARITSAAFEYETRLLKSSASVSNASDSIVVFIRVRNPLPVAATSYDPWSGSESFEWEVDISPQFEAEYSGYVHFYESGRGRLTLEPGETVEGVVVLRHFALSRYAVGPHQLAAGLQSSRGKRHAIMLTP